MRNIHTEENKVEHEISKDEIKELEVSFEMETVYICGECSQGFENETNCIDHVKAHKSKCYKCEFDTYDAGILRTHEQKTHNNILEPEAVLCETCGNVYKSPLEHECHIETTHTLKDSFVASSLADVREHMPSHYNNVIGPQANSSMPCNVCGNVFSSLQYLEKHNQSVHKIVPYPCELCGLVFGELSHLQSHIESHDTSELIPCKHCDLSVKGKEDLDEHMIDKHGEVVIIHTMCRQLEDMDEDCKQMKNILKNLLEDNNAIKQELFLIRNNQANNTEKKEEHMETFKAPNRKSEPEGKKIGKEKSKTLFIGDSITNHANIDTIEEATDSIITRAKAYSAIYDEVSNKAKSAAYFPAKNFVQVVPDEAVKDDFENLIIQTGCVDITNLKTEVDPKENIEYFKQETVMSARNMFHSCLLALDRQPSLKKVVLMKQTPRYDPVITDPLQLKPMLAQLFNNTLTELWTSCPLKEKIHIGTHNIECTGAI